MGTDLHRPRHGVCRSEGESGLPGGTIPVATGVTDAGGQVNFTGVSVGRYTVVVDTTGLGGDSLVATGATPSEVTITAQGVPQIIVAVSASRRDASTHVAATADGGLLDGALVGWPAPLSSTSPLLLPTLRFG